MKTCTHGEYYLEMETCTHGEYYLEMLAWRHAHVVLHIIQDNQTRLCVLYNGQLRRVAQT